MSHPLRTLIDVEVAVPTREEVRAKFEWVEGLFAFLHEPVDRAEQMYFLDFMAHVRNSADAVVTKLVGEVSESSSYQGPIFQKPEVCASFIGGSSLSDGHRQVETAERLRTFPELAHEYKVGNLSFEQAALVAEGATLDPSAHDMLLDYALHDSHEALRRQFNKVKAATATPKDHEAAAKKIHFRQPGGDQFGKGLTGYLLNEQSAILDAVLDPLTDEIFRTKWADGSFVSREHCRGLALVEMAKLAAGGGTGAQKKSPRYHLNLSLSFDSLIDGKVRWDQLCEVQGVGPISLERMKTLLNDAYINLVVVGKPSEASTKYRPNAEMIRHLDIDGRCCTPSLATTALLSNETITRKFATAARPRSVTSTTFALRITPTRRSTE